MDSTPSPVAVAQANVAACVWDNAARWPDRVALRGSGRELTYAALHEGAASVAGAAVAAGVRPGDRVLLLAPSVPEFGVLYYGLLAAGAILVTVNTMSTEAELAYVLEDAGCSLVLAWQDSGDAAPGAAAAFGLRCLTVSPGALPAGPAVAGPADRAAADTAVLLYTSGTTGRPKGAEITHGNLRACAEAFVQVLRLDEQDRFGTGLPLFHIFGQAVVMGSALSAGAALSLLSPFDADAALALVRDEQITCFAGVPTMYNAMLHAGGDAGPEDFRSLRLCASGGASLPAEVIRAFGERFGAVLLEGYGLTETTGAATFNGLDRERKAGFVGIPLPGIDVRVVDTSGAELPPGALGEVLVRGPVVMARYWGRPEATQESLRDGWLHTGDIGRLDDAGDLEIVDRIKDLVIRGGYNVYPREVEEVLYEHPDVVEVAVVGVPDPHFGEEVGAVVVLRPGARLEPAELRTWAKERLSAYKVPRLFSFVDALPKGSTGKILKRAIDRAGLTG
ncbi:MAG TPA: AMP-binding protein [Mycobacteriales bacterium]|jgi:long-chain acyl-CoA synthetase|nr:AMP-binding protein [Mycobacteriales bacterium]